MNGRVRRVDTSGIVSTYVQPYAWDDPMPVPATDCEGDRAHVLTSPADMEMGPDGSLYLDNGAGCADGFDTIQASLPDR